MNMAPHASKAVKSANYHKTSEILVLLTYHVFYTTVHRHTTIVTSETFVNSSMESCRVSSDRAANANGERMRASW